MNQEQWHQAETLFECAAALALDQRDQFIMEKCPDPEVQELVLRLLKQHDELETFHTISALHATLSHLQDGDLDTELGSYRLLRKISSGGMGSIYLAERNDREYEKTVAVKLVHGAQFKPAMIEQFKFERQILASLQHPNIATLYDGGTTSSGYPYVIMEYIEGLPIDQYCLRNQPTTQQTLKLIQQLCNAVQYAHNNLIIHRDIKPGNVLIDHHGHLKLVDFGIADRLHDVESILPSNPLGAAMHTRQYASPEQIAQGDITTTSDIYSIGMLIKTLLLAHDADLSAIMQRARAIDPNQRYANATALSDDLQRYLDHRPISLFENRLAYRFKKFVQRNKLLTIASSIATISLIISLMTYIAQTNEVAKQRDQALAEKHKADTMTDVLLSAFNKANPTQSHGEQISARDILDQSQRIINQKLVNKPLLRAELQSRIASIYHSLGQYPKASEIINTALNILEQHLPENDLRLIEARLNQLALQLDFQPDFQWIHDQLGKLEILLVNNSNYTNEIRWRKYHLDIKHAIAIDNDPLAINLLNNLLSEQSMAAADADTIAYTRIKLASLLINLNLPEQARPHIQKLQQQLDSAEPLPPILAANTHQLLGRYADKLAQPELAVQHQEQALKLRREIYGEQHPLIADTLAAVAIFHFKNGDGQHALQLLTKQRQLTERIYGLADIRTAFANFNLANVIFDLKEDHDFAIRHYLQAIEIAERIYLAPHNNLGTFHRSLGEVYAANEQFNLAQQHLQAALHHYSYKPAPKGRNIARTHLQLAEVYAATNRQAEARQLIQQSMPTLLREFGNDHNLTQRAHQLTKTLAE